MNTTVERARRSRVADSGHDIAVGGLNMRAPRVHRNQKPRQRGQSPVVQLWRRVRNALAPALRPFAWMTVTLLLGGLLAWWADRPIERIEVNGQFARVAESQVHEMLLPLHRRGFLSIDLQDLRRSLAELPWV